MATSKAPAAPKGLSPAGRTAWTTGWAVLIDLGDDPDLSRDTLHRYAEAVDVWASLRDEWRRAGRPVLTMGGATGRADVGHPLLDELARARREAQALGAALGFDPAARRKLSRRTGAGRPPGAASAADRAAPARRRLRSVD